MNIGVEVVVALIINVLTVGAMWGSLHQRMKVAEDELKLIRTALGTGNGAADGKFVARRECYLMESNVRNELNAIKQRLDKMEAVLEHLDKGGMA